LEGLNASASACLTQAKIIHSNRITYFGSSIISCGTDNNHVVIQRHINHCFKHLFRWF
jgi:hypothetical protein